MTPQERIEKLIHDDEGGWQFTDRSDDAGGPTYGGMTWKRFDAWQQGQTFGEYLKTDFIGMAKAGVYEEFKKNVRQCYHDEFWLKGHCDAVPEFARQMYLSHCVNAGLKEGLKCLQMAANATIPRGDDLLVDGHWGPRTASALLSVQEKIVEEDEYPHEFSELAALFKLAFSDAAMSRYIRIVQQNSRAWREYANDCAAGITPASQPRVLQSENLMGWFNRAISYRNK